MGEYSYWSARIGPALRFVLFAAVLAIVRVTDFVPPSGPRPVWLACLFAAGFAWTVYAARAWGACAALGDEGVVVRNLATSRFFLWDDVDRFAVSQTRGGRPVAVVMTRRGQTVRIHGIQADLVFRTPFQASVIEDLVGQLNGELCRRR